MLYKPGVLRLTTRGCSFCLSLTLLFHVSAQAQNANITSAQLAADAQKMKEEVVKIGQGNDITIVRRDGQEFYGTISKIEDDFVSISEVDLKAKIEIDYQQIKKVSKGYGHKKAWNGKRIPPRKYAIGLIIGAAAILIPIILVASAKD
jgi:hypothetical protein